MPEIKGFPWLHSRRKVKIISFSLIISSPGWVFWVAGRKKRRDRGEKRGREAEGSSECPPCPGGLD